ncbi:hypothetical protein LCGC14_0886220 [marine sediment metagenome]|uniref:Uncharacterized protein n=1 Tax=marine sediment metagenome TaxID=412755 RepID=A0A0F9S7H9_9ZZZZ|nr:hypothetical protein [bacterium]
MLIEKSIVKDMVSDIEKMDFARREIQNESITAKRVNRPYIMLDKVGIFSTPLVESKEDLEVYMKRAHERLISLPENLENVGATITFKRPQPESRIEEIISKYRLNGYGVKLEGSHDFKTMARYPVDKNYLKHVRAGIIATYDKNKELVATTSDQKKKKILEEALPNDFIETFELNQGIFALYCLGKSNDLIMCENEEEIYIVDIGPIEVRDHLLQLETNLPEEIVVIQPSDIAYYVRKFLS